MFSSGDIWTSFDSVPVSGSTDAATISLPNNLSTRPSLYTRIMGEKSWSISGEFAAIVEQWREQYGGVRKQNKDKQIFAGKKLAIVSASIERLKDQGGVVGSTLII